MVPSLLLFSWTPSSSLSIVGGALLLALWGLLAIWARLGRVVDARCPACMHRVAMLPEPTCPECGQDLAPGVVPADAWPPRMRPVFLT